jgi:calcineurin-like phosphoesterase
MFNGVIIEIDDKTFKAVSIKRINMEWKLWSLKK